MSKKIERRNFKTEVRAVKGDAGTHIEGYASTFNDPYVISDWFGEIVEQVAPGAFARAIQEKQDVRCLFNHDPNHVLGRTKANTLTIQEDSKGLAYNCTPPAGARCVESIERGDIDGSSFGFIVTKDTWQDERDDKGRLIKSTRTIQDVDLFDVGPVTYPANDSATAAIRSFFPGGVPAEFRSRMLEHRDQWCKCDCDKCAEGMCSECTDPECEDANCEGEDGERSAKHHIQTRADAKTKKVAGVDLTSDCFAYVGDPDKTSTWKLPIKFPGDDEKTKSHIRNALARFEQTEGIPADEKPKVLAKIKAAAKANGIDVDEGKSAPPAAEPRQEDLEALQLRQRQIQLLINKPAA
jgi:HK97 family phage prohead protease